MSPEPADKRKLQAMIKRTVTAGNRFQQEQASLNEYCRNVYGFAPGDRDVDSILDSVLGCCGVSSGMTADEFDQAMRDAS